ncbi:MAG: hypothetical protein N2554_06200 [Fimbriimonadales bacterium]|nr:hypothetical protein [Fimbriimonadales bacterium]
MLRLVSSKQRLRSLLWVEAGLIGVFATLLLSVSEAQRSLTDVQLAIWTMVQHWKTRRQIQINLKNEPDIGTQITEFRNVSSEKKLIQVIALGEPDARVIEWLKEHLKKQTEDNLLHHLIIVRLTRKRVKHLDGYFRKIFLYFLTHQVNYIGG